MPEEKIDFHESRRSYRARGRTIVSRRSIVVLTIALHLSGNNAAFSDQDNSSELVAKGRGLVDACRFDEAISIFNRATASARSVEDLTACASLALKLGKRPEAQTLIGRASSMATTATDYILLCSVLVEQGSLDRAMQAINRSIEIDGKLYLGYELRGYVFLLTRKHEKSERDFLQAIKINPKASQPRLALSSLYLARNQFKEAEEQLLQLVEQGQADSSAWTNLGIAKAGLGKTAEAEKILRKARQMNPDSLQAHIHLALLLENKQNLQEAKEEMTQCIRLEPRNSLWRIKRGHINQTMSLEAEAVIDYTRGIELNPCGDCFYKRASFFWVTQRYKAAIRDCNSALSRSVNGRWEVLRTRGSSYWKLNKLHEAKADLDESLKLNANDAAYITRASVQKSLGDKKSAIADLTTAINMAPAYANSYFLRGELLTELRDYKLAYNDFKKAAVLRPDSVRYITARDQIELLLKNREGSRSIHE